MSKRNQRRIRQSGWFDIAVALLLIAAILFILEIAWPREEAEIVSEQDAVVSYDVWNTSQNVERPAFYLYSAITFAASILVFFCISVISPWFHRTASRLRFGKWAAASLRRMLCLLIIIAMVFPIYWMIITSFLTNDELLRATPAFLPSKVSFVNYERMLRSSSFRLYITNTVIVSVAILLGEMIIGTMAAYGFSIGKFKGRDALFLIVLGSIAIPAQALYVSLYMMAAKMNWINTFSGLILPNLVSGLFIFFIRQAFLFVDKNCIDAAKMEGMGRVRIITRVLLPMSKPVFIMACLMAFSNGWNSYIWPKLITTTDKRRTIALGIQNLRRASSGMGTVNYNEVMAGAVLAALPIILLILIFQRHLSDHLKEPPLK